MEDHLYRKMYWNVHLPKMSILDSRSQYPLTTLPIKMTPNHKLNALLGITLFIAIGNCVLLFFVAVNVPTARDIGYLVQGNKDRLNHTINMILDVTEQAERMIVELRAFVEGRVLRAICSSAVIKNAVGFLCDFVYPSEESLARNALLDNTPNERVELIFAALIETKETLDSIMKEKTWHNISIAEQETIQNHLDKTFHQLVSQLILIAQEEQ